MPDIDELLAEWEDGGTGLRPARLQAVRGDLMQYTGMAVPHRVGDIENWLPRMKAQVTRRLREAAEEQSDSPGDGETVAETPDGDGGPDAIADSPSSGGDGPDE